MDQVGHIPLDVSPCPAAEVRGHPPAFRFELHAHINSVIGGGYPPYRVCSVDIRVGDILHYGDPGVAQDMGETGEPAYFN